MELSLKGGFFIDREMNALTQELRLIVKKFNEFSI